MHQYHQKSQVQVCINQSVIVRKNPETVQIIVLTARCTERLWKEVQIKEMWVQSF